MIFLIHDLLAYPDLVISEYTSLIQESDYSFNPFLAENSSSQGGADAGLQLSFGIQKSAESDLEPFSEYANMFRPVFYHVDFTGSSNQVTEIPLITCSASQADGYIDQKSGTLLCPDISQASQATSESGKQESSSKTTSSEE